MFPWIRSIDISIQGGTCTSIHPTKELVMQATYRVFALVAGLTEIYFDVRLQRRGTDFTVYANTGYNPHEKDSVLLQVVLDDLINGDSGVEQIRVSPYAISLHHSKAVEAEKLITRIASASEYHDMTLTRNTKA